MPAPARRLCAVALAAVAAVATSAAVPSATAAPRSAISLQSRINEALRGVGASHVDYRFAIAGVGTLNRTSTAQTAPASNEKLFTAIAALNVLSPDFRYATTVSSTAPIVQHAIDGDLVLRGAGDPTLTFTNLLTMAKRLHAQGLRHVTGHLIVDDTRYGHRTRVSGWKHKFVPVESGTVDAFSLDQNEWRDGASFDADPTPANSAIWRKELHRAHITVAKRTEIAPQPATAQPLLTHNSAPLHSIIKVMLSDSINFYAEMLLRELGAERSGHGSPSTGVAALRATAGELMLPLDTVHDGSGLSYADRTSPATLVTWLDRIRTAPYFSTVYDGLPRSCATGTLKDRLCGPNVRGRVRAKTGTLNHVSSLSGYFETQSGHHVTFSVLVSGFPDSSYNRIYHHVDSAVAQVSRHG